MPIKNRSPWAWIGFIFTVVLFSWIALLVLLAWTSLPLKIAALILNLQGYIAHDFSFDTKSFFHRTLEVGQLAVSDEKKDFNVEGLQLEIDHKKILRLKIHQLSFRDKIKSKISLGRQLRDWRIPSRDTTPICIDDFQIDQISVALSATSQPFKASHVVAKNICFGTQIHYSELSFESDDIQRGPNQLQWHVGHNHFYDLPENNLIYNLNFPADSHSLQLVPSNGSEILALLLK
jgi:hypothetical protein